MEPHGGLPGRQAVRPPGRNVAGTATLAEPIAFVPGKERCHCILAAVGDAKLIRREGMNHWITKTNSCFITVIHSETCA